MIEHPSVGTPIEPFFFGQAHEQRFACYHAPAEPARDCGVVICQPILQEYIRSHRACLQLAQRLAEAGFPCLRFDYSGVGDSAGDTDDIELDQWKTDIDRAIDELRDRSGVDTTCLIGLRFGASLAATVAAERRDIASLVLWDPVVDGKVYIEQTTAEHQAALMRTFAQPKHAAAQARPTELLGFPVGRALLDRIDVVDLLATNQRLAPRVLLVESHTGEPAQRLAEHARANAAQVDVQHVPSFMLWTESVDKGLVPTPVLVAIVTWLSEVHI